MMADHSQTKHVALFFLNIKMCWLVTTFICFEKCDWTVSLCNIPQITQINFFRFVCSFKDHELFENVPVDRTDAVGKHAIIF